MKAAELAVPLRVPEATIRAKARFIEKALSVNAPGAQRPIEIGEGAAHRIQCDDGRHSMAGRIVSTLPGQPRDRMLSHLSTEHSDV
jgi:hypothetical protein